MVDALKTLQQKIRKLEAERMQAHKNYLDVSHKIQPAVSTQPETEKCSKKGKWLKKGMGGNGGKFSIIYFFSCFPSIVSTGNRVGFKAAVCRDKMQSS